MPRKLRELRSDLRKAGFVLARQRGSHQVWQFPGLGGAEIVLSGGDGDDAKPYQERDVQRVVERAMKERQQQ
jgi:predicted RNA binding protein YcfA (HicA-like mRNA interferase family)